MSQTVRSSGTRPQGDVDQEARKAKYEHAIQEMEKFISVASDGAIVLNARNGSEINVDPDAFNNLSTSLQYVNGLLQTKQIAPGQIRLKTSIEDHSRALEALNRAVDASVITASDCAMADWVQFYWWGFKIHGNECWVQAVILDFQIDAAVAAIAALFSVPSVVGPLVLGIIAALAQLGAAVLQWRDNTCGNQGLVITVPWSVVGTWVWCS